MDGRPHEVFDTESVVQNFYCRSDGIGGTRSIGHHPVLLRVVLILVYAEDDAEVGGFRRSAGYGQEALRRYLPGDRGVRAYPAGCFCCRGNRSSRA